MKTQILQLESHDDIISIQDKMGWVQAGRIVLVWPTHGRVLTRRLDLVLLQRHSASLGAQLALVTSDRDVRFHAAELEIPVFKTLRKAQNSRWRTSLFKWRFRWHTRPPEHPRPDLEALRAEAHPAPTEWLQRPAARLGFFSLGVFSFLAVVAALLPGARVSVVPNTEIQKAGLVIAASANVSSVRISGEVPAQSKMVTVEGKDSLATTGRASVPEKFASGYVRFTNLTDQGVSIPLGTVVATLPTTTKPAIRFATTDTGSLPAGSGKSISLPVRALSPGAQGNLYANRLVAVEGSLGLQVEATNPVATNGGANRMVPGPSEQDYKRLYEKLSDTLEQQVVDELRLSLAPGDVPITATVSLSQTLIQVYDPPMITGTLSLPGDQLNLTLRQEYHILVVSGRDLQELAQQVLDARLPSGRLALDPPQISNQTKPVLAPDGTIRWKATAERTLRVAFDQSQVIQAVQGRSVLSAMRNLANLSALGPGPRIDLFPGWWPVMPFLPFRIEVVNNRG